MTDFLKIAKSIAFHFAHICAYGVETVNLTPHKQHRRYLIEAMLQHNHNYAISVAFRPISEETSLYKATPQVVPNLSMNQI